MATTRTTKLKLQKPAVADRNWGPTLNANLDAIDDAAPVSALAVTPLESPSTTRGVAVAAGPYLKADGTLGTYAGGSTTAFASGDSYVSFNPATGAVTVGAAWPTTPHIPLAIVTASSTAITAIADARRVLQIALAAPLTLSGGTMADGAVIGAGTTTGLTIGGATTQKLGFFARTPTARPAVPAATAAATYGANEQAMLQALHNAIRALGLGG